MANPFKKVRTFYKETVIELKKSTWPTMKELRQSTVIVLIGMILLGLFISLTDFSLYNVVDLISTLVAGK